MYKDLVPRLQSSIDAWQEGDRFVFQPSWINDLSALPAVAEDTFQFFKKAGWTSIVTIAIITFTFIYSCVAYFAVLGKQLKSPSNTLCSSSNSLGIRSDGRLHNLRSQYKSMRWEAGAVCVTATLMTGLAIWLLIDAQNIFFSSQKTAIMLIGGFSSFNFLGTAANCLIAWRLYQQRRKNKMMDATKDAFEPLSLVAGIKVQHEVAISVDAQDPSEVVAKKKTAFQVQMDETKTWASMETQEMKEFV